MNIFKILIANWWAGRQWSIVFFYWNSWQARYIGNNYVFIDLLVGFRPRSWKWHLISIHFTCCMSHAQAHIPQDWNIHAYLNMYHIHVHASTPTPHLTPPHTIKNISHSPDISSCKYYSVSNKKLKWWWPLLLNLVKSEKIDCSYNLGTKCNDLLLFSYKFKVFLAKCGFQVITHWKILKVHYTYTRSLQIGSSTIYWAAHFHCI